MKIKNQNSTFHQYIASQFNNSSISNIPNKKLEKKSQVSKPVEISLLPTLPVSFRSSENDLAKLKYHQNKDMKSAKNNNNRNK